MPVVTTRLSQDQILADRDYFENDADTEPTVSVAVGFPQCNSQGRYECIDEIVEMGTTRHYPMNSCDKFGALKLALEMLDLSLEIGENQIGKTLIYKGREDGDR